MNALIRRTARLREAGPQGIGRGSRLLRRASNLIANSGFEVDTTGWIQFQEGASTFARVAGAGAHSGAAYAVLTVAGGAGFAQRAYDFASNPPLGQVYTLGVWVKANNAGAVDATASLRLWGIGGAQADAIINANTLILTNAYQQLTVSGAIDQADRTAARFALQITTPTADGDEMALDDASARRG